MKIGFSLFTATAGLLIFSNLSYAAALCGGKHQEDSAVSSDNNNVNRLQPPCGALERGLSYVGTGASCVSSPEEGVLDHRRDCDAGRGCWMNDSASINGIPGVIDQKLCWGCRTVTSWTVLSLSSVSLLHYLVVLPFLNSLFLRMEASFF